MADLIRREDIEEFIDEMAEDMAFCYDILESYTPRWVHHDEVYGGGSGMMHEGILAHDSYEICGHYKDIDRQASVLYEIIEKYVDDVIHLLNNDILKEDEIGRIQNMVMALVNKLNYVLDCNYELSIERKCGAYLKHLDKLSELLMHDKINIAGQELSFKFKVSIIDNLLCQSQRLCVRHDKLSIDPIWKDEYERLPKQKEAMKILKKNITNIENGVYGEDMTRLFLTKEGVEVLKYYKHYCSIPYKCRAHIEAVGGVIDRISWHL